ncbi:MAG TPA: aromatic ring-hydroxylating dioxygenase subunit alpha [Vineibacter sp.]|nr:aromatic ring-hydroxylating dioxygenase subunit alpha [Vineibacter sp.]
MTTSLADDATVIARLLDHIDRKTTDLSGAVWRQPVEHYVSLARLEAELKFMRAWPTPFCPSAALPETGSYVARSAAGTPILAARGNDGRVRAFRNACRHRGAQLAEGSGCTKAFTCRYHAWTYGLDGQLRGIPHQHGFPDLDKAEHGLVPVHTVEKHGLVFVAQDGDGAEAPRENAMPDYFGPQWRLLSTVELVFEFNWKIFVDGLLEGYHIRSTHAQTFYPRQYDNINVVEFFGRNTRVSYPYRVIEKLRDAPAEARRATSVMTQLNHLFPNVSIATFPTHTTMSAIEPLAVDRTRVTTYFLSDRPDDAMIGKARDFVTAGTTEDRDMGLAVQRGLASGANQAFTFGLFEGGSRHFHRNLAAAIDAM